ncbi:MFS transporter [Cyanobacteria bacterium FACHB-472]|nr:MFS transporter [Cyanobacteria bacterium FACHB-472]
MFDFFNKSKHQSNFIIWTLFTCVFIAWFTEVLLSPFYPQFFRKVFGVEDLAYTGYYIFVCRLAVVLASPVWGLLARWFEVKHLLYVGQAGTAVMTALMATATNADQFLFYTVLLLLFKSSYLLVYTLIIQLAGEEKRAGVAGTYQAVSHGAIIAATIAGAWMLDLEAPLHLFYWVAVTDVFQLGLCIYLLKATATPPQVAIKSEKPSVGGNKISFILAIGMVILTFQLANNLVRPYFTEYAIDSDRFGVSLMTSSFLFLIPSVMAIAALPYIRSACKPQRLKQVYCLGMVLLVVSLYLQGGTNSLLLLIIGRALYGFYLAVTETALELQLFSNSSENAIHLNYSLASSFANVGRLGAPLAASWLVSGYSLAAPFLAAASICIINLLFARFTIFQNATAKVAHPLPIPKK